MMALGIARRHRILFSVAAFATMMLLLTVLRTNFASAAACTAPTTDYGTVSGLTTASLPAGTYKIWTRMVAADTTNNTYLLQVDSTCFTVGGSAVKTYTSAQDTANTRFSTSSTDTTDWIAAPTTITFASSGTHTLTMIGNAPNVVVDRVILTQDLTTAPQGLGDNVANPPDATPPSASITSPAANAVIGGTQAITVSASDDVAVTGVDIYDGATKLGSATLSSGSSASGVWTYNWNTSALTVGSSHVLTAHVTDGTNPIVSGSVTVTIRDATAPTGVAITSPAAGSTQSGTLAVTATANDNVGVTRVEFYLDGTLKATDSTGPSPFAASIDISTITGSHSLTVKAYDAAGNITTSSPATSITVVAPGGSDTTPPTVAITAPPSGAVLSDDLNNANFNSAAYGLTATASDASGIKSVLFKIDGTNIGTADTAAPYTATLNLTTLTCGAHTITATATDNSTGALTAVASATFTATYSADITATPDCHVTYLDLSALASKYNQTGAHGFTRADINQDGVVNYLDLSALAGKYNN